MPMDQLGFDHDGDSESRTWDEMRKRVVENAIQLPDDASPEAQRAEMRSQSMSLLRAFVDEGIRIAKQRGLLPMTSDAWDLVESSSSIAQDVLYSLVLARLPIGREERARLTPTQVQRIFQVTHATPARFLIDEAKKGETPLIDKAGFEEAVGRYLQSEFRIAYADRIFLTACFDVEITAYLKEIFQKDILTGESVAAVMGRPPSIRWLIGRAWALVRYAAVSAMVVGALYFGWIGEVAAFWLVTVTTGLLVGGTLMSFFGYSASRHQWKSLRPRIVDLPREMLAFYSEVHSEGPLSVRR